MRAGELSCGVQHVVVPNCPTVVVTCEGTRRAHRNAVPDLVRSGQAIAFDPAEQVVRNVSQILAQATRREGGVPRPREGDLNELPCPRYQSKARAKSRAFVMCVDRREPA
jgi:hypothetical protein